MRAVIVAESLGEAEMALATAGTADEPSKTEVLVIGAGPAGLFAASELLRYGVKPRIIERRLTPHHETRGTAFQPAVLEVLDRAGVIQPFLADSMRIKEIEILGPGQARIGLAQLAGLGCKYEFQCSQPQWRTESVLRDHLAGQGLQVEFGVEATSIAADGAGVTVTLDKNGREEVVRADYLIGAGGGHSVTRHSMQEHLDGETYGGRYIVADLMLGFPCPPGRGRVVIGASGFVLISPLPEGRFLIFVNREEADRNDAPPSAADLTALLNARVGTDVGLTDLRWVSYFLAQRRLVSTLGAGRRFLLGDAGHLSSPMGGEGINSALMDGADIAWKLALVLRGAAKPSLLETYAIERELADHHALEVTNEIHNTIMNLVATCAEGVRPSFPLEEPAQALAGLRKRSMLDVSYKGSLLVERGAGDTEPAPGARFPGWCDLQGATHHLVFSGGPPPLDDFRARWDGLVSVVEWTGADILSRQAGLGEGGLVLVRPDGFIGFRRAAADENAIKALDAHLSTYLHPNVAATED
jgi:2-polyprenyl-6-methoxyphenol hydroxylase-like FAD-dependent oxidoreductase